MHKIQNWYSIAFEYLIWGAYDIKNSPLRTTPDSDYSSTAFGELHVQNHRPFKNVYAITEHTRYFIMTSEKLRPLKALLKS